MGYTHYYNIQDPSQPLRGSEIAQDIQNIILASEIPIGDGSDDRDSEPILEHDLVRLNGIGDEAHETLCYPPDFEWNREFHRPESEGFSFCKTARKPYDVVVCAALLAIKHHQGTTWRSPRTGNSTMSGNPPTGSTGKPRAGSCRRSSENTSGRSNSSKAKMKHLRKG